MRRIRIVHYCRHATLGGTTKKAEVLCRLIDKSKFESFFATQIYKPEQHAKTKASFLAKFGSSRYRSKLEEWDSSNARIPAFAKLLGTDHLLLGDDWADLRPLIQNVNPDILHVYYGGEPVGPLVEKDFAMNIPAIFTTHVFAHPDNSPGLQYAKKMFFVTNWLLNRARTWTGENTRCSVLFNPIEAPRSKEDLRQKLGIPVNAFVVGRIGRPASSIHHPLALDAYAKIEVPGKTFFLAMAPSRKLREQAKSLHIKNFIELPSTINETEISRFYNTIDVLAHSRKDGETFGMAIAEAMRHGKPVISHRTPFDNGHLEVLGEQTFITEYEDVAAYSGHLRNLMENPNLRLQVGWQLKQRAQMLFDARNYTRQLEEYYEDAICPVQTKLQACGF